MPNLRQYYLVNESELQKVKETERPCLDYSEIYDTIVKNKEELAQEKKESNKLKIEAWDIFYWNE